MTDYDATKIVKTKVKPEESYDYVVIDKFAGMVKREVRNTDTSFPRSILFYVSGPYTGRSNSTIGIPIVHRVLVWIRTVINIIKARKVAIEIWKLGGTAICPHTNTILFDMEEVGYHDYLDGDVNVMLRCDVLVLMKKWRESFGTAYEIGKAVVHDMDVIGEDEVREYIEFERNRKKKKDRFKSKLRGIRKND